MGKLKIILVFINWIVLEGMNKKMNGSYYEIVSNGCKKGYAFVRDYLGNKCYYGTMKQCVKFIDDMMKVLEGE